MDTDLLHRTHACGSLGREHAGTEVVLTGWVSRVRDHGALVFVDLRDRTGVVQLVFSGDDDLGARAKALRAEYVIGIRGRVRAREAHLVNPNLTTGEVEVAPDALAVHSAARTPPFYIEDGIDTDETLRLRYRYLDLRRPEMQQGLMLRHRVTKTVRDFFDTEGFLEVETPMLTRSTPEGARDYLVPSRVRPGRFFALPQSPQLFKQLLMVAGMERYFQIVRCFRDEDLRADRQPEFTQIDVEMSFVDEEDIMALVERMLARVYGQVLGLDLPVPFPRLEYAEAMVRYGSDRPDLRNPLEIVDISKPLAGTGFKVFRGVLDQGGVVRALRVPGAAGLSRREIDGLTTAARERGAGGLAWLAVGEGPVGEPDSHRSSFARFLSAAELAAVIAAAGAGPGDLLLVVADGEPVAAQVLGHLRQVAAERFGLVEAGRLAFTWVTGFPLLEWDEDQQRHLAVHHPFTAPLEEDLDLLERDSGRVRARAYDLVLNGVELGGGSIRIHRRDVQEGVFRALGFSNEEARRRFGFLLEAFEYGTPPHGGIAFGLDRMVMMMAGRGSIRDVIAFPKTARASCLMTGAPAEVDTVQLADLHLQVTATEPDNDTVGDAP